MKEIKIELTFQAYEDNIFLGDYIELLDTMTTNNYPKKVELVKASLAYDNEIKCVWGHGESMKDKED